MLKVGDWVEIRSAEEIIDTLDDQGTVQGMPFMPEMLPFIGRRFRVFKRIHKTCDTIDKTGIRRVRDTVALEDLRCDGAAHGGCGASCMLFWKEQWLKPVSDGGEQEALLKIAPSKGHEPVRKNEAYVRLEAKLEKLTRLDNPECTTDDPTYRCLITEMKRASLPMARWDLLQYVEDVSSGNRQAWEVVRGLLLMLFNWVQTIRRGAPFPNMERGLLKKTPNDDLQLQPGDLVKIKGPEEIINTLDANNKTRGLRFDVGMFRYCGGRYRVAIRANRFIDQKTGKMLRLNDQSPSILLDGVLCHADYWQFCPRSEYLFWREAWLERVEGQEQVQPPSQQHSMPRG